MNGLLIDAVSLDPTGKGVSRVLQELAPRLATRWTSGPVRIATTPAGRALIPDGMNEHVIEAARLPGSVWEQAGLDRLSRRLDVDVVYAHREVARVRKAPLLLHVPEDPSMRHRPGGSWRDRIRTLYELATFQRSLKHAGQVVVSTDATRSRLASVVGDVSNIQVIPLGVDQDRFFPDLDVAARTHIFHLGSSDPRDRTIDVVESYLQLRSERIVPPLVIAGNLGALARGIQERLGSSVAAGDIHVVGRISDEELRRLYSGAVLCVQPATAEGFGLQPLEALACGAPLIAGDGPALRETVGGVAQLVPAAGPIRLAEAMDRLLADQRRRSEMSSVGREHAATYSWESTADRIVSLLQELVSDRRRAVG